MPIERATNGAVTRRDLRPDDYLIHWPELVVAQAAPAPAAIETVAQEAQSAIKHLEELAAAAVLAVAGKAEAELKQVAEEILHAPLPAAALEPDWDGSIERRDPNAVNPFPDLDRRAPPAPDTQKGV